MAISQSIQEKMLEEAYSVTPNYDIDYNDPRFGKVESEKNQALTQLEQTYGGMIGNSDKYYQDQIDALDRWEDKQTQLQQEQTDFTIQQIEQQKDKAHKDYLKEQSASFVDWQKQSNQYGTNAEQMASAGLTNTGFAESSQVSMYNTYQNRVATARASYDNAVLNYNNSIKEAQLANSAALAEIAFTTLQKQLELSLAGFQYKNQLIIEQANKKTELDNMYWNRYQDVLQQINTENAMKEDIRQYNETMKWQTEQAQLDRDFNATQAELDRQHDQAMAELENKYQVARDEANRTFQAAQAELERKHDKEMLEAETKAAKEKLEQQHKLEMEQLKKEQEYKLAQLDKQLANEKALVKYEADLAKQSLGKIVNNNNNNNTGTKKYTSKYTYGQVANVPLKPSAIKASYSSTSEVPINMASVKALGYGAAISGTKLASLVASGEVRTYVKNGQRYYEKNPLYYKTKYSFNK
jgi:hypothetical protein